MTAGIGSETGQDTEMETTVKIDKHEGWNSYLDVILLCFLIQLIAAGPCGPVVNHAKEGNKHVQLQEKWNATMKVIAERNV